MDNVYRTETGKQKDRESRQRFLRTDTRPPLEETRESKTDRWTGVRHAAAASASLHSWTDLGVWP